MHIRLLNQLPTYENMLSAYECLENGGMDGVERMEKLLGHRKERMFFMIVNLIRLRPTIVFAEQISAFKARCDLRQNAGRGLIAFAPEDVDAAIEVLTKANATHSLELNSDLVACC